MTMVSNSPDSGDASKGQSFLTGPTLYLRGVSASDAATAERWWPAPFPLPSSVATDQIKEALRDDRSKGGAQTFIACRRSDGQPVGSIRFWYSDLTWGTLRSHVYPAYDDPLTAPIHRELVTLAVPWALEEFGCMAVLAEIDASFPGLADALEAIGMRPSFRLREAWLRAGQRRDLVAYEGFSKGAIDRFGMPPQAVEGTVNRITRSPAQFPPSTPVPNAPGDPPAGSILLSERLYLRAFEPADVEQMVQARMRETETFHDNRWPTSSLLMAETIANMSKDALPSEVIFAIVRRSDDQLLGTNGLFEIDWVNGTAETATELFRAGDRGAGYGTEAKHLLLEYAFGVIGLHMVRSFVWEPNTRSAVALRKQGYRDAGFIAWRSLYRGAPRGDFVFDLLASEWFAARQ